MDFGYFTLSDNRYPGNPRTSEQFMDDIVAEAIHADRIGMHSVWIGEHHFNRRGSIPCPGMLLANVAAVAKRVRLAPAVVVLPLHNPIAVAEEWATLDRLSGGRVDFAMGRGYDAAEYAPFGADFQESAEIFAEGSELLWRCWTEEGPFSFTGRYYHAENIELAPKPVQQPLIPTVACFSRYSMELAARRGWNIIFAPFAATVMFGGLAQAVADYREACAAAGTTPGQAKCSYFIHVADTPAEDALGRECLLRYFGNPGMERPTAAQMPPTMQYMAKVHQWIRDLKSADLDDSSVLLGPADGILESLKRVEAAGLDEVILYFNLGLKPHEVVLDQMSRFMEDVAPAFATPPTTARTLAARERALTSRGSPSSRSSSRFSPRTDSEG